jgi:hypothetical protein
MWQKRPVTYYKGNPIEFVRAVWNYNPVDGRGDHGDNINIILKPIKAFNCLILQGNRRSIIFPGNKCGM